MITTINKAMAARRDGLKDGQKGFTLVELLVVIIIIGILAAIAIPVFLSTRENAWKASVESDLKNAAVSIESWSTSHNGSLSGYTPPAAYDASTTAVTAPTTDVPDVKVTLGNKLVVVKVGTNGYKITGTNKDLGTGTGNSLIYDSANGGLQPWS